MGNSKSRLALSRGNHPHSASTSPQGNPDPKQAMSSPPRRQHTSSPTPSPSKPKQPTSRIPFYIADALRDPELLSDNWFTLAQLESRRQQASRESLVRTQFAKPPEVARYSIAQSAKNNIRNRYQNVAPYDLNAVRVGEDDLGKGQGMYLNASWVRERAGGALWIASQAPLPNTHFEFLALCTDITPEYKRVRTIVQLTPWVEKRSQAAHPYFPNEVGDSIIINRVPHPSDHLHTSKTRLRVAVARKRVITEADCIVRSLEVRYEGWPEGESPVFEVRHLAYDNWADHGVPDSASTAYWLAILADRLNRMPHTPEPGKAVDPTPPPILVHCSAGVGRTGTFIAMCSLLRTFNLLPLAARPEWDTYVPEASALGPLPDELHEDLIVQEVNALREQRIMMVQMPDQMAFIYEVLAMALSGKFEGRLPPDSA